MTRLAIKRNQKGISQRELAKLIGVHYSYIGLIKTKRRSPSLRVVIKISRLLTDQKC
ncbi:MAG: transcriptional regulator [Thermotogae bacterium]|nr:MAG: transcriptional regulator [Thermotogota bacterium]